MPTVLHIMNFVPRKHGTLEKFLLRLAQRLDEQGIQTIYVVAGKPVEWFEQAACEHATVQWVDGDPVNDHFLHIARMCRELRPEVMTFWYTSLFSPKTLLLTRLPWVGRTIYFDRTSRDVVDRSGVLQFLAWLRGRLAAPCYWRVVSVSDHNRQRNVLRSFLPEKRTQVIYNGVEIPEVTHEKHEISRKESVAHGIHGTSRKMDDPTQKPEPSTKQQPTTNNQEPKTPYFLFAGQLTHDKGVHTLITAYQAFRGARPGANIQLWLVGDKNGHCDVDIPASDTKDGQGIHILGMRDDVPDLMSQARAVIVPSEWPEACSFVSLEAMASGRPTVVSDAGSLPALVDDTGAVFPKGNVQALAEILCDTWDHSEKYDALGAASHRRAAAFFSIDRMLDDYLHLLQEAVSTDKPGD